MRWDGRDLSQIPAGCSCRRAEVGMPGEGDSIRGRADPACGFHGDRPPATVLRVTVSVLMSDGEERTVVLGDGVTPAVQTVFGFEMGTRDAGSAINGFRVVEHDGTAAMTVIAHGPVTSHGAPERPLVIAPKVAAAIHRALARHRRDIGEAR